MVVIEFENLARRTDHSLDLLRDIKCRNLIPKSPSELLGVLGDIVLAPTLDHQSLEIDGFDQTGGLGGEAQNAPASVSWCVLS